jgi:hypothetical protein
VPVAFVLRGKSAAQCESRMRRLIGGRPSVLRGRALSRPADHGRRLPRGGARGRHRSGGDHRRPGRGGRRGVAVPGTGSVQVVLVSPPSGTCIPTTNEGCARTLPGPGAHVVSPPCLPGRTAGGPGGRTKPGARFVPCRLFVVLGVRRPLLGCCGVTSCRAVRGGVQGGRHDRAVTATRSAACRREVIHRRKDTSARSSRGTTVIAGRGHGAVGLLRHRAWLGRLAG